MLGLAALVLLVTAGLSTGATGGFRAPERMLLRLHELPLQYAIGNDSGCGPYGTENAPPTLAEYVVEHRPNGCEFRYERLFPLPGSSNGPPVVSSLAIALRSARSAEEGFAIAPELLGYTTGNEYAEVPSKATVGDTSSLLHTDDALVAGNTGRPGSAVFWRSGTTLAAIYVAGVPHASADRIALRLARVQQRHIQNPASYTEAQQDWSTVSLENPAIHYPVYWLGRNFKPGNGLPRTSLYSAFAGTGRGEGVPGTKAELEYEDFTISSWTSSSWKLYNRDPILGPLVRSWHCTEKETLDLPGRRVTIYSGYAKDFESCPQRAPDVFLAEIRLDGMVFGIGLPICPPCIEPVRPPYASPYASARGLEAIARGLRLRSRKAR